MDNLHSMKSDLTLTFISCEKNAENRETTYYYKLEVEWQPLAAFVLNSQAKEVWLHEIRIGYTTKTMNDIRSNSLPVTFNIDDNSISLRVIDQNRI